MRYYFLDQTNQAQGPVEVEALWKLRAANVLHSESLVAPEGATEWVPLKSVIPCLDESVSAPAVNPSVKAAEAMLARKGLSPTGASLASDAPAGSGGSLFYWIAALSVANAFSGVVGSSAYFFFGLGVTLVIGAIGHEIGSIGIGVALVVNLMISAAFAAFGYFGNRYHLWPFFVGGFLYLLDGLVVLLMGSFLGVAFHVGILIFLIKGALSTRGIGE